MANPSKEIGFRLARLELYNWGTFHREIWTMTPENQTAVLTGANGSGKSTVVDALLTLLVEPRRRNYNLASGADSSRERNERTYVRGQYSRSRGESAVEAKPISLRGAESHSVLLGVFYDAAKNRTVTLAQVLWISNVDRVEKRYYVASYELSIEKHFAQRHVATRDFPKGLDYWGGSFGEYIAVARKGLGLSGKLKALDLFNETVSVKDIASLNTFIRDHMLDKGDPEERVGALKEQYRELNEAHDLIQRASKQTEILAPLVKAGGEYRRYEERMQRYEAAKTLVPFYVAAQACDLLKEAIRNTESLHEAAQSRLTVVDSELESKRSGLEQVNISIAKNDVGQEKREIEAEITPLKREIAALKRAANRYDEHTHALGLPVYRDEGDFSQNRSYAEQRRQTAKEQEGNLKEKQIEKQTDLRERIAKGRELDSEIRDLKARPSNITGDVARIREEISETLSISLEALPFVGELLKVRDEESAWEGALERLLSGFARNLIVPEKFYLQVSEYVNAHHLRGRLVYQRVDPSLRGRLPERPAQRDEYAYKKLQIIENTPFQAWLIEALMKDFAYICVDSEGDFQYADRAITQNGLIKHNAKRHEKDDRRKLGDRREYALGWDNRQKIRQLERELDDLSRQVGRLQDEITIIQKQLEQGQNERHALDNLLEYGTFSDIDWRTPQAKHDQLQRRLEILSQQSQELQELERQRDNLGRQIKDAEGRRDTINGDIRTLKNSLDGYADRLHHAESQIEGVTEETNALWEQVGEVLEDVNKDITKSSPLTIEKLGNRSNELETFIQRSIANFKGSQNNFKSDILDAMNTFRREYPDEGVSLTSDIEALAAYEQIHHRLENDDLPKHQDRFKQMVDRTVTRGIQVFSSALYEHEHDIDRSINELNESLARVDYGNGSIIRLIAEPASDPEIHEFKQGLRACHPNAGDSSQEEYNRVYELIKALIQHFNDDPNWTRRVTDVRRWRVFAAEQLDASGRQVDYYSDSSGKSGGQKAKLAYTILASAIAYQYGLQDAQANDRSFRFVVIDEAFSKLDDDNARFAMNLFEQLGLQLLVVTPMQQLHVIENYVRTYHVVVNNTEGNYSRLFNLTQPQYQERHREFQAQSQPL